MKRTLDIREQYKLLQWLPRARRRAETLKPDQVPRGFSPGMAFQVFGFTGNGYHERTRERLDILAITPTHAVKWFDGFVARFRLEATCGDLFNRG